MIQWRLQRARREERQCGVASLGASCRDPVVGEEGGRRGGDGVGARSERGGSGVTAAARRRVAAGASSRNPAGCGWRGGGRQTRCRGVSRSVVHEEGGRRGALGSRAEGRRKGGWRRMAGNRERAGAAAKGAGRAVGKRGAIEGAERGEGARLKR